MSTHRSTRAPRALAILFSLVWLGCAGALGAAAPEPPTQRQYVEVPLLDTVSMRIERFEKPIRVGVGEKALKYDEALVLEMEVLQRDMEALPPSMEPFLYIGAREVRIFQVTQSKRAGRLLLRFHLPEWREIQDGAPMVLTIEHGAPQREPKRFERRQDLPRFDAGAIEGSAR